MHKGASNEVSVTVTSPLIRDDVEKLFLKQTLEMIELQVNIQRANEPNRANNFLDNARQEGFAQAVDALEQYYSVKQALKGSLW